MHLEPLQILTDAQEGMLRLVAECPETASNLGARLWGTKFRKPQSYARPAGKLLHYLRRLNLAMFYYVGPRTIWRATYGGRQWLAKYPNEKGRGNAER